MTKELANWITRKRLGQWEARLRGEAFIATPAVMLSMCHDPASQGQLVVSVTEDMPDELACAMLKEAAAIIEKNGKG